LTTRSEPHCELRKSEGTLNYESLKEGTFIDNTFKSTLRKSEGTLNYESQHIQSCGQVSEHIKFWVTADHCPFF
jgi:hypothetical protein